MLQLQTRRRLVVVLVPVVAVVTVWAWLASGTESEVEVYNACSMYSGSLVERRPSQDCEDVQRLLPEHLPPSSPTTNS